MSIVFADTTVRTTHLSALGTVENPTGRYVIAISNTGNTTLTISGVSLEGSDASQFAQTNNCSSVAAGSSCTISMTFTPTSTGSKSASISISHNASGSPTSVPITGTGRENTLSISPLTLDFGPIALGRKNYSREFIISATAYTRMTDLKVVFAGENPDDFSLAYELCPYLSPGSRCSRGITFSPRGLGSRSAIFRIVDSAGAVLLTSNLVGKGVQGIVSIVADSDFGSVDVGRTSATKSITVANTGDSDITLKGDYVGTGIRLDGDQAGEFSLHIPSYNGINCQTTAGGSRTNTIRVGQQCRIDISFRPKTLGTKRVRLLVETVEDGGGVGAEFELSGTGVTPVLDVSKTEIDFGVCQVGLLCGTNEPPAKLEDRFGAVWLLNIGNADLTIESIGTVSHFSLPIYNVKNCNYSFPRLLKPNEKCYFMVGFNPKTRGSIREGVYIRTNEPKNISLQDFSSSTKVISVSGTAVAAEMSFSPQKNWDSGQNTVLGWGGLWPKVHAAKTVSIANIGELDALLTDVRIVGSTFSSSAPQKFRIVSASCSDDRPLIGPLRGGGNCNVEVLYVPTQDKTSGTDTAQLEIRYRANYADGTFYYSLIGGATADIGSNIPEGVIVAASIDGDSGLSVIDSRGFSFTLHDTVGDRSERSSQSLVFGDSLLLSEDINSISGAVYRMTRHPRGHSITEMQGWQIQYGHIDGSQYRSMNLPDTAEVFWRRRSRIGEQLATTGWIRVCSDRVWAVQDGYQLLFHVGDQALTALRPGHLFVNSTAEASVITDVRCGFGGAVWIEGYAFGVNENGPPLRTSSVPATRFSFALDRHGAVTKREVVSAPFDVVGLCAAPANEQQTFCSEAKKAVGW